MTYTDAHCHLGTRQYDTDRNEIVNRMLANEVNKVIMISCSKHDLQECLKLRKDHPGFKLAMSIHPQDLEDHDESRLEELWKDIMECKPEMIGEIGLDYYSHPHTKEYQLEFFRAQLEMAKELILPVNIHSRKASKDTLDILRQYSVKGLIHSYSGSIEMAELFIKAGYYISFGASILFPNAKRPREVVAKIPLDKLLIETDSPYQSPVKGHVHEPMDVVNIYEEISRIRGINIDELKQCVEANFDSLFSHQ